MKYPESFQFQKNFEINSFFVNPKGSLRIKGLADLFQEIAWKHADSQDFGRNLSKANQMWVLARLELKLFQMPKWGQKVELFTGGRGVDKIFAFREFLMRDLDGNVLVRGMSSWLLLDSNSKKMLRPEMVLPVELFDPALKPEWQPGKIIKKGELIKEETIKVKASDLDLYDHVNNTSYVRWVEDLIYGMVPHVKQFSINYLSECLLGDEVTLQLFKDENAFFVMGSVEGKASFSVEVSLDSL
jgi:acyl-ACP thioesterase